MSFYGVTDLWTYVIGALGIILLPGPNSLFVLSVATVRGVKAGYQGAMGVFVGDTILLLLTALGAAGLLRTYPALFMVVKYAGAAYLTWVGVNLVIAAIRKWRSEAPVAAEAAVAEAASNLRQPVKRARVISWLHPKPILCVVAVCPDSCRRPLGPRFQPSEAAERHLVQCCGWPVCLVRRQVGNRQPELTPIDLIKK